MTREQIAQRIQDLQQKLLETDARDERKKKNAERNELTLLKTKLRKWNRKRREVVRAMRPLELRLASIKKRIDALDRKVAEVRVAAK